MKRLMAVAVMSAALFFSGCGADKTAENFYTGGQFEVGKDLPSGEYLAVGEGNIEVRSSSARDANNLIASGDVDGQRYIDVYDGEFISVNGAKLYPATVAPKMNTSGKLTVGQYKVGTDIPSGEYKFSGKFDVADSSRVRIDFFGSKNEKDFVEVEPILRDGDFCYLLAEGQYLTIRDGEGELVEEKKVPAKVLNLGMTLEDFKNFFNSIKQTDKPIFDTKLIQVTSGEVQDTFNWQISSATAIQGAIDKKSGKLKEVWVLSQSPSAEARALYSFLVTAVVPGMSEAEHKDLMDELFTGDAFLQDTEAVRGNIRYMVIPMPNGVVQLLASAKDL